MRNSRELRTNLRTVITNQPPDHTRESRELRSHDEAANSRELHTTYVTDIVKSSHLIRIWFVNQHI